MLVLSIHDGHDAGATLVQDGRVVLHSSEERRVNKKNMSGVPRESISALFERTGIDPRDVDLVSLCGIIRTGKTVTSDNRGDAGIRLMDWASVAAQTEAGTKFGRWILPKVREQKEITEFLGDLGLGEKPIKAFDHHLCHAACAYYHRPWEGDALVLTHDGAGDGICATVNVGRGHELEVRSQTPKFHSLANFMYSAITAHLGLKPWEHEYKVMGMAPYGRPDWNGASDILRELYGVEGLHFRNRTGCGLGRIQKFLRNKLAGHRFDNLCAACQLVFEELMVKWVHNAIDATGINKVAGAGGAFLNVKANKILREDPKVDAFYAYPASDDGGTPIGAAVLGYLHLCRQKKVEPKLDLPKDMYLGFDFSDSEMEQAIQAGGYPYHRMDNAPNEIGQMLADGKIVARFDGREEVGPRALGNRTIMANPQDLMVIRKINFAIKKRDFWMPFAASILEEEAPRYIENLTDWAFYMIEAFDTKPEAEHDIISGMHPMDLTVRPQIVNELNPNYRDIIRAFRDKTGVGGILNTSFNLHGFPIVGTPAVALDTLHNSDLDALQLGPFMVGRKDRPASAAAPEMATATA